MSRKTPAKPQKRVKAAHAARRAQEKFAAGEFAAAARHCRLALRDNPGAADLWHLLSATLFHANTLDEALAAVQRARALAPNNAEYANTAALILDQRGDAPAAETILAALLGTHPGHADAAYNLGRLLLRRGAGREAATCFEAALAARPDWLDAHKNLAHAFFAARDPGAAETVFMRALKLAPGDGEILRNLGDLRQHDDDTEAAATLLKAALAATADAGTLLRLALLRPIFSASAAHIVAEREAVAHNLALIEAQTLELHDPVTMLGAPTFYFAYHGHNDRDLMTRFGNIVERAWRPTPLSRTRSARRRPRVAFVSAHFHHHAIGRLYVPLLERLPRDAFEVAVLALGHSIDEINTRIMAAGDLAHRVDNDYAQARRALYDIDADVIFYPDVGMEAAPYWLAAERIAPVQALGWGHPVTSGLASLDYFVSSQHLEPAGAAAHYRETLVELPTWPVAYEDPGAPHAAEFSRAAFGFSADDRLYLCPQSLFKLHPDFDAYLGAILELDAQARVVLVGSNEAWRRRLGSRFAASLGSHAERIYFLPALSVDAFYALIANAEVVLDTLHFSGGVTSFESIWAETPFVTERGAYMRGRVTAGLADLLGLEQAVVHGAAQYAERAVELAHPGPARRAFIDALAGRKQGLLETGDDVAAGYRDFFVRAIDEAQRAHVRKLAS